MFDGWLIRSGRRRARIAIAIFTLQVLGVCALPIADACICSAGNFEPLRDGELCLANIANNGSTTVNERPSIRSLVHHARFADVTADLTVDDDRDLLSTLADFYLRSTLSAAPLADHADFDSVCLARDLVVAFQRLVI